MSRYSGVSIVGVGETQYERIPSRPALGYLTDSINIALKDCGLRWKDIDGLALNGVDPDNAVTVAEHFGLAPRWVYQGAGGNAFPIISILAAADAIKNGDAEVIVVAAAAASTPQKHREWVINFNKPMRDYVVSYGFGGENGYFGLIERRHRHEYGTTREQLGKLAVTQRGHAMLNPNALFGTELTLEAYLSARLIADPLRLFDCVMPCAGGDALVLVSTERALSLGIPDVRIRGGGQHHNHAPQDIVALTYGWADFADRMFEDAGIGREDVDLIQPYDDYPIMNLIQLEDLGFCAKGEGGEFIERTSFTIDGQLPLNTGGGQLSVGQAGAAGGLLGTVETVRQLLGRAGARQVKNARIGLANGFGMTAYGKGLSASTIILENTLERSEK